MPHFDHFPRPGEIDPYRGSPPCTIFPTSREHRNIVHLCTHGDVTVWWWWLWWWWWWWWWWLSDNQHSRRTRNVLSVSSKQGGIWWKIIRCGLRWVRRTVGSRKVELYFFFSEENLVMMHWQLIWSKLGFYFSSGITLDIDVFFLWRTSYWSIKDKTYKKVERNPF